MSQEEIDILKELAEEKIESDPKLTKEDFLFELCAMTIESSANQTKVINDLIKTIDAQGKRIQELDMRLSVIELCVMPLVKDQIGEC
jgi:hypothetical protein